MDAMMDWIRDRHWAIQATMLCVGVAILSVFIVLALIGLLTLMMPTASAQGQVIHFNGQTLDLSDASNVLIQSSNDVRVFNADAQGGAVTVTTNIVTVTVWMKP